MNNTMIEGPTVTLAEIAEVAKTPAAELWPSAGRLDIFVGVDCAGRLADLPDRRARPRHRRRSRVHEHEQRMAGLPHAAEQSGCTTATGAVAVATREAATKAGDAFGSRKNAHEAGVKSGREAGRKFEETHPAPADPDGNLCVGRCAAALQR